MFGRKKVTLRNLRDNQGIRYLTASLLSDGTLKIEGQDLGEGVERVFGPNNCEYEWSYTIQPPDVLALASALGDGGNVLFALRKRFSGDDAADLKQFMDEHGIRYAFWSRVGD